MTKKPEKPAEAPTNPRANSLLRLKRYAEDARLELRKVTWPTVAVTKKVALMVLAFVAVMAVLLGLVDLCLSSLIKTLLS
ncbi:MAG: preprotein translocase subunit SecE [Desulfovibrionaceae bacterium]|nr:preprotein translocase subunit SecE [Desulfovibrionaceae bacterium]